jgi:hypothetical protein
MNQVDEDGNLLIFTGGNDQTLQILGLVNAAGTAITGATITASIIRAGAVLPNTTVTFTDVSGQAGNYNGILTGFVGAIGLATLQITGIEGGVNFAFQTNVCVVNRTL